MTTLREASQQALDALDGARRYGFALKHTEVDALLDALRAALAEPVQEPVAWLTPGQDLHLNNGEGFRFSDWTPLYTAPPQRKPLTEVDLRALYDRHAAHQEEGPEASGWWAFARAVERAHGIGEQK